MACTNCNQNSSSFPYPGLQSSNYCETGSIDTRCSIYTGPYLSCLDVDTNTCLQDIIQSIDTKVCQFTGNYSQYNFHCLANQYIITDEGSFVSAITDYSCNLATTITNLQLSISDSFTDINSTINNIINPGLVSNCPSTVIYNENSSLNQILTAQTAAICNLSTSLSLGSVNWNTCYTVTVTPTTIVEGFNQLISQICQTKALISSGGVLPTFDNTGTCLSSPTASDSLVDTIVKIRSRLCQTPTFNANNLAPATCIQFSGASTLENVIDAQNNQINSISNTSIRSASTQFVITPIDPSQPCLGRTISLNSAIVDRNVAMNSADTTPGTLFDKLAQGTNVTLDFGTTNPGKVTISASGGAILDEKVKATSTDTTPGYLETKIVGDAGTLVTTSIIPNGNTITVSTSINLSNLIDAVLTEIETDSVLKSRFCTLVNSCPVTCSIPTNASVTFQTV